MTLCALTFFLFANVAKVRQWHLRFIAFALLISWVYDLIWLIFNTSNYWSSQLYDGDAELGLRRFVILMSYIAFFFKLLYFLVFWKVSVEFNRFFNEDMISDGYSNNERDYTPPKRAFMMDPYQP
jgi:hypothetical protein